MDTGKRTAEEAGLDGGPDRPAKSFRIEDFLESMDPSVRIKLRSMFDDGLLQASDLDERNIAELRKFDAAVALEILEHYSSSDLSAVRNRRAYLAGVTRRRSHLAKGGQEQGNGAAPGNLHPDVQQRFNDLTSSGGFRARDLDKRCMDTLSNLPPHTALAVLDKYSTRDFSDVRNPAALFMATVKQTVAQEGGDYGTYAGGRGRADKGGRGGGRSGGRGGDQGNYASRRDQHQPLPPRPVPPAGPPPAVPPSVEGIAALAGVLGMPGLQGLMPPGGFQGLGGGVLTQQGAPQSAGALGLPPGMQLPPGVQLISGVQQGALLSTGGLGGQQFLVGPNGILTPVQQAGGTIMTGPVVQPGAVLRGHTVAPGQGLAPAVPPPGPAVPPPGVPSVPPEWAAGRKQYGLEQAQLGVRVAEFHGLSPFALYVHPSPALKLQQLWDDGNELVSMLDDKVWQVLAEIPAAEALVIVEDAGDKLANPQSNIRNINAYFMSVVRRLLPSYGRPTNTAEQEQRGDRGRDRFDRGDRRDDTRDRRGQGGGFERDGRPGGGYGGSRDGPPSGTDSQQHQRARGPGLQNLIPELKPRADQLIQEHAPLLREEHFDEGVVGILNRLGPGDGLKVLNELGNNSMAGVRNLPAYIMGICKRYGPRDGGQQGGRGGARGGGGGGRGSGRFFRVPEM